MTFRDTDWPFHVASGSLSDRKLSACPLKNKWRKKGWPPFPERSVVHLELNVMPSLAITDPPLPIHHPCSDPPGPPCLLACRRVADRPGVVWLWILTSLSGSMWIVGGKCDTHRHTARPFFSEMWASSSTPG